MASAVIDPSALSAWRRSRGGLGAWCRRLARGRPEDPPWVRPALAAIVAATLALLVWGLDRSGWANSYYSAAVLAGTRSWKAFFFGSFDAGNYITVDKPPMALWLMEISARIFGLTSWSMLLPEALAGVAAVLLLFTTVRRLAGPRAALVAAAVMAVTPVAVAIFRYNNPDALLTLLLVAAAAAMVRSLETGRTRWLLLCAALVSMAFTTKYLEAYVLLPALVVTYLVAARGGLLRRLGRVLAAGGVLVASSGWWVAIVELVPASSRPWIGGSAKNSVLDLILNYDGVGRLTGQEGAGPAGGPGGGGFGFGGAPGLLRMFNDQIGGQVAWLLPLALVGLGAGLWARRRAPRTDLVRAGYLLFGLWLITCTLVFDEAGGILHSYYTVAMAPAVAALVGAGTVELWRMRSRSALAGVVLGASVVGTAVLAADLLGRTPGFVPWLRVVVLVTGLIAGVALALPARVGPRRLRVVVLGLVAAAVLAGPVAYSVDTVVAAGDGGAGGGSMVAAGPPAGGMGFGGFRVASRAAGGARGFRWGRFSGRGGGSAFGPPPGVGGSPGLGVTPRHGVAGGSGSNGAPPAAFGGPSSSGISGAAGPGGGVASGRGAAEGRLVAYLTAHRGTATWIVATASAMDGSSIELASGDPVLAMGGFSGTDPAMTVARLESLVASGKLRYVLAGGMGGPGGSASSESVMSWVRSHGTVVDDGGGTSGAVLYDLSNAVTH
jgi:4-amino-4-deoxy-L-arabinose transferase-like glycosyltransferase